MYSSTYDNTSLDYSTDNSTLFTNDTESTPMTSDPLNLSMPTAATEDMKEDPKEDHEYEDHEYDPIPYTRTERQNDDPNTAAPDDMTEDLQEDHEYEDHEYDPIPYNRHHTERQNDNQDTFFKMRQSMDCELDKSWEHVQDGLRKQYSAQYKMSVLLEQSQEKERYWQERCMYVEDQFNMMNSELRKMERSLQTYMNNSSDCSDNNVDDKDEIIRQLHAKIASRDTVIECLEEKVVQKDRLILAAKSEHCQAILVDEDQDTPRHHITYRPVRRLRTLP